MPELSVVIVAQDSEQRAILQVLVDGTSVARTVHSCATFPVVATDPVVRRIQTATPDVALVDIATLGHTALHMNLKPLFTVADAIRNLHRLDSSLLESFMTRHNGGLQLLAGPNAPAAVEPSTAEFARLFDLLVSHFRYVVVDASTRMDATTRLVCNLSERVLLVAHADVASLWSAARLQQYLGETGGRERVQLVLNRFRKIPGFSESDAEAAAGIKLLWKIPNQYFAVSAAIDRGIPLMHQNHTEIARSFTGLAGRLTENDVDVKRRAWSLRSEEHTSELQSPVHLVCRLLLEKKK